MQIIKAEISVALPFGLDAVRAVVAKPALIADWHPWVERVSIFEQRGFLYRKSILSEGETELTEKCWSEQGEPEFHFQAVQGLWSDQHYRSKIELQASGADCGLTWQGRLFSDKSGSEAERMEQFFREGIAGLKTFLRSRERARE